MREMRGIEGRKAVVLLSEGFYSDHVARELEDAAAAAAHSYSVVYSLDLPRYRTETTAASWLERAWIIRAGVDAALPAAQATVSLPGPSMGSGQ